MNLLSLACGKRSPQSSTTGDSSLAMHGREIPWRGSARQQCASSRLVYWKPEPTTPLHCFSVVVDLEYYMYRLV